MSATDHLTKITDGRLDHTLTPNCDALDIAIADMKAKLGPRLMVGGPDGARARMALAIQDAIMRAMARELDARAPEGGVTDLMLLCLGDVLAGMALKYTHSAAPADRLHLLEMMGGRLMDQARTAVSRVDQLQPHEVSGVMAPRSRPPGSA